MTETTSHDGKRRFTLPTSFRQIEQNITFQFGIIGQGFEKIHWRIHARMSRPNERPISLQQQSLITLKVLRNIARTFTEDIEAAGNIDTALAALQLLRVELHSLVKDEGFLRLTNPAILRMSVSNPDSGLSLLSVPEKIGTIIHLIDDFFQQHRKSRRNLKNLRDFVPDQKIAPLRFEITDGKLSIAKQNITPKAEDEENVEQSRTALVARGETIIEELRRSNCDRRLLESIVELQRDLNAMGNVIRLGILNISCEAVCGVFEKELPDALRGMLLGQTRGISMYVAQFPEWQRFSENAAAAEFNADDIQLVFETARQLTTELEANDKIADPEVPASIRALLALFHDPAKTTKRAAFAMLRTIENLVAKAIQFGVDLLEITATKTKDGVSGVASKVIIGAVLALALNGAVGISPLAGKVPDAGWVKAAAEIIDKQIAALAH